MSNQIHGTIDASGHAHPVLDINYWEQKFPFDKDKCIEGIEISTPGNLAIREQAVRLAQKKGKLGPSILSDVFVWADTKLTEKPWLTRIGGSPWRPKRKPWPIGTDKKRLTFLGQIYFGDSKDILPCDLPGEVALVFGNSYNNLVSPDNDFALEWSSINVDDPIEFGWLDKPCLPFTYQGIIHRTAQYPDWKKNEPIFNSIGYEDGGLGVASIQSTSIGTFSLLPQGWPFSKNDGNTLVATLSSFFFSGKWPTCDVPRGAMAIKKNGAEGPIENRRALDFCIGDAGCIWIYRRNDGSFSIDAACS